MITFFVPFDADNLATPALVETLLTAAVDDGRDATPCHTLAFTDDEAVPAGRFAFRYVPTRGRLPLTVRVLFFYRTDVGGRLGQLIANPAQAHRLLQRMTYDMLADAEFSRDERTALWERLLGFAGSSDEPEATERVQEDLRGVGLPLARRCQSLEGKSAGGSPGMAHGGGCRSDIPGEPCRG